MKRENFISWDEYFMGIAKLSAKRSKDPNTQVGACIVNADKRIVGIGYNGFPRGISDDNFPWERSGSYENTKYPYVVHAEMNAIFNSITAVKDCIVYVNYFPCSECMKHLVQAGIKKVIYEQMYMPDSPQTAASKKMAEAVGIEVQHFVLNDEK